MGIDVLGGFPLFTIQFPFHTTFFFSTFPLALCKGYIPFKMLARASITTIFFLLEPFVFCFYI
jgi:hypothetical protein